jgi:osmoprotectant transport system permease protein
MESFFTYLLENVGTIWQRLLEHLVIVGGAMAMAVPVGMAVGIMASRRRFRSIRGPLLYLLGLGQAIPSLAIIALAVGILGIGMWPAVVAIFFYALLPIARNTVAGIESIPPETLDAARGMGMTGGQMLRRIELPLAAPLIMAGIRTATVFAISAAALAYLIGGGGLGDLIFSGIALFRPEAMLAGAIPVAIVALVADWVLGKIERGTRRQ